MMRSSDQQAAAAAALPRIRPRTAAALGGSGGRLRSTLTFPSSTSGAGSLSGGPVTPSGGASKELAASSAKSAAPLEPGEALTHSDDALVKLLQMKPKHVPQLHSRDSFRRYFACMPAGRMRALLQAAYAEIVPAEEVADKVEKRMALLEGCLQ